MTEHPIYCVCTDTDMNLAQWQIHVSSDEHMDWFASLRDNINEITITCGCGDRYTYATCHNHFKSKVHVSWQKNSKERYNNVLIICKCGDITTFANRNKHNNEHIILQTFEDD